MPRAVNASFATVTFLPREGNFVNVAETAFLERREQCGKCMDIFIQSWFVDLPRMTRLCAVTVTEALHSTQVTSKRPVSLASIGGPEQGEAVA